jgi:hypothetical protein
MARQALRPEQVDENKKSAPQTLVWGAVLLGRFASP